VAVRRGGQGAEWFNVEKAVTVDLSGALLATSWGLPQLMGFNWRVTGRPDVRSMVLAFQRSVHDQVAGFFGFVQSSGLAQAILDRNWRAFALRYNGPGQVDHYAGKLTEALVSARRLLSWE
jgi:hypothetical protein